MSKAKFIALLDFIVFLGFVRCQNVTDLQILDSLLKGYDRRATPTNQQGIPTEVSCQLYIRSFGSISASTMDYEVDIYLHQFWKDDRLNHPNITKPMDLNDPNLVKVLWKPEVFFPNAKKAEFQYVTVPNVLVRIHPEGSVLYMLRLKLSFSCMMDLSRYPLDSQVCTMEIASFAKTTSELSLIWKKTKAVQMYDNLKMPQFEIEGVQTSHCKETFHIGEYSCLQAEFLLHRSIGHHLVQTYMPTILIVVISWVSFWMDIQAVPARITLGITTLLTISSKASDTQGNLPQVSYVKAIDVWLGTCTAFVFCALLEFTLVNYLWRRPPPMHAFAEMSTKNNEQDTWLTACLTKRERERIGEELNEEQVKYLDDFERMKKWRARRIDELSRFLFPAGFLIFNMCYWPFYMS